MKQILFAIALVVTSLFGIVAQTTSNLVVFVEDAKPFYAIVNGIKQNAEPQTNVKITGLTNPSSSIKIVFSDGTPDLNKSLWFETMGKESTYRIVKTKKGYKLRFFGEVDIVNAVVNDNQNVIVYHTVESQPSVSVTEQVVTPQSSVSVTEHVVTNTTNNSTQPENVNLGINVGGLGVNMNVNINETESIGNTSNTNYSSTTTTTTTTTSSNSGMNIGDTDFIETEPETIVYVSGYTGNIGCAVPESSVNSIKSAIESENFSNDKMRVAKQAIKNRCITVNQAKEIMSIFDFEDKKLEFAKYAYDRTYDVDNFYLLNNDFDFSSTKEELNKYLETK